jgi:hypothetical protein
MKDNRLEWRIFAASKAHYDTYNYEQYLKKLEEQNQYEIISHSPTRQNR